MSCEMEVTWEVTIWELLAKQVWVLAQSWVVVNLLSTDLGVYLMLIAIFTIKTESSRDSSSA